MIQVYGWNKIAQEWELTGIWNIGTEQHLAQMRSELRLAHDFARSGDYEWADLCSDLAILSLEQAIKSDRA